MVAQRAAMEKKIANQNEQLEKLFDLRATVERPACAAMLSPHVMDCPAVSLALSAGTAHQKT